MSLSVFQNVALGFGKKSIIQELNMRIAAGDRIGLIGPNGSGKTSLLRLLAGEQAPDYGSVKLSRGARLGYLPQDIEEWSEDARLLRFVMESVQGRAELDQELADLESALAETEKKGGDGEELMALAEKLSDLHERIAHYDMHYTEYEAMRILHGLGFKTEERDRPLAEFSGGWKMRAALAALLFQKPDLLLLDEPTNNLDMPSVTWLSDFLKSYNRAFVLICHDREFLNEQVARIVSFEVEGVRQYSGNYQRYLALREEEEVILENKAKNIEREREQTERFINRFRAQANKARAVQSRIKALDRMEEVETYRKRRVMRAKFPPVERSASEPVRLENLGKRYGDKVVLAGVNLRVARGERIGIIGVNGAGKTTLLRMIAGEIEHTEGKIAIGGSVQVGYYAQHHADTLCRDSTMYQEIAQIDPTASATRVRSVLGAFLFSGDDVDKKIGVLSGGERARVALARLLIKPGNLLLMDEPTNHLDLESAEALAESLDEYDGTLLFVSHNRSFVRRLATRIWNVENQTVETYPGTLDEYMDTCRKRRQEELSEPIADGCADVTATRPARPADEKVQIKAEGPGIARDKEGKSDCQQTRTHPPFGEPAQPRPARSKNRVQKLKGEVVELERRIAELEAVQKALGEQLADPQVYADKSRSVSLVAEHRRGQQELDKLATLWELAQGELEEIERS